MTPIMKIKEEQKSDQPIIKPFEIKEDNDYFNDNKSSGNQN